ncbi:MAG: sulfatase-like hydrolase/transferase, partial [Kiritimatiellia bacterium]
MKQRPNVLFLMSDQHRHDVTGYAGNRIIRTPNLDRLAETGVVFRNAYTPSPLCVPARQCMMAGQLPKTCKCEGWIDLEPGYQTFSREFSRYAYNTVCSGKLHHLTQDQMQGWTTRIAPDASMMDRYIKGAITEEFARYSPAPGTGKWSNQREIEEARAVEGPYQKFDARAVDAALDYLDRYFADRVYRRPQSHRPLLFKLSLLQPHYPFFTDEQRFAYYLDRVPVYLQEPCDHPVLSLSQQYKPVHVSENAIRRATAAYYGMIDQVDCYFGQVMDKLEALGEDLDDWIII